MLCNSAASLLWVSTVWFISSSLRWNNVRSSVCRNIWCPLWVTWTQWTSDLAAEWKKEVNFLSNWKANEPQSGCSQSLWKEIDCFDNNVKLAFVGATLLRPAWRNFIVRKPSQWVLLDFFNILFINMSISQPSLFFQVGCKTYTSSHALIHHSEVSHANKHTEF